MPTARVDPAGPGNPARVVGGPLPLTIGVTGHRDLLDAELPHLRALLAGQFTAWLARAPHTPLHVLSPLAAGADLLVAEVAQALADEGRPVVLRAVLPMAWQDYAEDFSAADQARAQALLARLGPADRLEPAPSPEPIKGERRIDCYEQVGRRVARHVQLLVALWDGAPEGGRAGTAQIVAERQAGIPLDERPVSALLRDDDRGPVLHLPVGRQGKHAVPVLGAAVFLDAGAPPAKPPVDPARLAQARFEQRLDEIEAFNRAAVGLSAAEREASARYLLPGAVRPAADPGWARLEQAYVAADVLALRNQRRNQRVRQSILALALLIPLLALLGDWLPDWFGLGYPALFAGMVVVAAWNRRRHHHDRSLLYRALAEALRVQLAWRCAGLPARAAHYYLRRHQATLDWMGSALRSLCLLPPPPEDEQGQRLQSLATAWITDQANYHGKSEAARDRQGKRWTRTAYAMVGLALLLAIVSGLGALWPTLLPGALHSLLGDFAGSLPALAGCLLAYTAAMAHHEVARESERMKQLHGRAAEALAALPAGFADGRALDLVHEVGVECLRENAEWVFLHRNRQPEPKLD